MFDVNVDVAVAEDVDRRLERYRQREKYIREERSTVSGLRSCFEFCPQDTFAATQTALYPGCKF